MKKRRILAVILTGIILAACMPGIHVPASAGNISRILQEKDTDKVQWPAGPKKKGLSSDSAILMELSTGQILYKKMAPVREFWPGRRMGRIRSSGRHLRFMQIIRFLPAAE